VVWESIFRHISIYIYCIYSVYWDVVWESIFRHISIYIYCIYSFRVKNHDFTPKNHIFFQLRREAWTFLVLGYFVWKITILPPKKSYFFQF
jgi:hypothetical protein